jgi:hypothetical protein
MQLSVIEFVDPVCPTLFCGTLGFVVDFERDRIHIRVIQNALISGMYPTQSKTRVETKRVTAVDVSITAGAKPSLRGSQL